MIRSIALLFLLASGGLAAIASPENTPKLPSLATSKFTGEEQVPVTIPTGVEISHSKLWKGVDHNTALIVVRNFSGRDLDSFGLDMSLYPDGKGGTSTSYHAQGQLLHGEKRIIKVHDRTPIIGIRLVWSAWEKKDKHYKRRSWYSANEGYPKGFARGKLIVFTFNPNNKITVIYSPPS